MAVQTTGSCHLGVIKALLKAQGWGRASLIRRCRFHWVLRLLPAKYILCKTYFQALLGKSCNHRDAAKALWPLQVVKVLRTLLRCHTADFKEHLCFAAGGRYDDDCATAHSGQNAAARGSTNTLQR